MSMVQPPLNRPTESQLAAWSEWSEKELLVAMVLRTNAIAGLMVQIAEQVPQVMRMPAMRMAMKLFIKPDKSSE